MLLEYLPKLKPLNDPNVGKSTIHGAYGIEYVKSRSPGFIPCHPPRPLGPFSPSRTMGDCRHPWDSHSFTAGKGLL